MLHKFDQPREPANLAAAATAADDDDAAAPIARATTTGTAAATAAATTATATTSATTIATTAVANAASAAAAAAAAAALAATTIKQTSKEPSGCEVWVGLAPGHHQPRTDAALAWRLLACIQQSVFRHPLSQMFDWSESCQCRLTVLHDVQIWLGIEEESRNHMKQSRVFFSPAGD